MEKEHLFSVRGFETETSSFAPKGCLRVSIVRFFDARSNGMLRMSLRTLWNWFFAKIVFFYEFLKKIRRIFALLLTFYRSFSSKVQIISILSKNELRCTVVRNYVFLTKNDDKTLKFHQKVVKKHDFREKPVSVFWDSFWAFHLNRHQKI